MSGKGIYVSPDDVRANRDAKGEFEGLIQKALNCIDTYLETSDKIALVEAIQYLSTEYVGNEISVLGI